MKTVRYAVSGMFSVILLSISHAGFAQQSAISDCRAIEDRLARFDCYENLEVTDAAASVAQPTATTRQPQAQQPNFSDNLPRVTRPVSSTTITTSTDTTTSNATAIATTPSAPPADIDNFGKKTESGRLVEGKNGKSELIGTIAKLEERSSNLWRITLANGQVWRQMESKSYRLQEGEEVRIYPTRWGSSYRLTTERLSGFIQVERVD